MPTIDIPDKICSHCGGIRWYVYVNKKGYTKHSCFLKITENRKAWRQSPKGKEFMNSYFKTEAGKKHREKYEAKPSTKELRSKLALLQYHKEKANNPEKVKNRRNKDNKKLREKLTDGMIKHYIVRSYNESQLNHLDIPQELIEIKRKQLLLIRQINNHENKNMWLL